MHAKDYPLLQNRYRKLQKEYASREFGLTKLVNALDETIRWKDLQLAILGWMRKVAFGRVPLSSIKPRVGNRTSRNELAKLYGSTVSASRRIRNRALANLFHLCGISVDLIAPFLFMRRRGIKRYLRAFDTRGVDQLFKSNRKKGKKVDNPHFKEALLSILHSPPADFGINRTTWTTRLLSKEMAFKGYPAGHGTVSEIIRRAGYRFRKAREVLTSNDPQYRRKLKHITKILSHLGPRDRFFSIDEFGPFAVKQQGGRRFVPQNTYPTIPQWQRSKGFLIVTAAPARWAACLARDGIFCTPRL